MWERVQSKILAINMTEVEFVYPEKTAVIPIMIDHIICSQWIRLRLQVDLKALWEIVRMSWDSWFHIVYMYLYSIPVFRLRNISICDIGPSDHRLDIVQLPFRLYMTSPPRRDPMKWINHSSSFTRASGKDTYSSSSFMMKGGISFKVFSFGLLDSVISMDRILEIWQHTWWSSARIFRVDMEK